MFGGGPVLKGSYGERWVGGRHVLCVPGAFERKDEQLGALETQAGRAGYLRLHLQSNLSRTDAQLKAYAAWSTLIFTRVLQPWEKQP